MKWEEAKKSLLEDEKLRRAYNRPDPIYAIKKWFTNLWIRFKS